MSEMKTPIKTLNGHALEDTEARAKVNQLSEEILYNYDQTGVRIHAKSGEEIISILPYRAEGYSELKLAHTKENLIAAPYNTTVDNCYGLSYKADKAENVLHISGRKTTTYGYRYHFTRSIPQQTEELIYCGVGDYRVVSGKPHFTLAVYESGSTTDIVSAKAISEYPIIVIPPNATANGVSPSIFTYGDWAADAEVHPLIGRGEIIAKSLGDNTVYGGSYNWTTGELISMYADDGAVLALPTVTNIGVETISVYDDNWYYSNSGRIAAQKQMAVTDALPIEKTVYINSVNDMRNRYGLVEGMTVVTLGYYYANDGGGATFKIRKTSPNDIDNGGNIIVIGNYTAEMVVDNVGAIDVRKFGARGDYSTDDTAAFVNALAAFDHVYVSAGKYYISAPVVIGERKHVELDIGATIYPVGDNGIFIMRSHALLDGYGEICPYFQKSYTNAVILVVNDKANDLQHTTISGIKITGSEGTAIEFSSSESQILYCTVHDVIVYYCQIALHLNSAGKSINNLDVRLTTHYSKCAVKGSVSCSRLYVSGESVHENTFSDYTIDVVATNSFIHNGINDIGNEGHIPYGVRLREGSNHTMVTGVTVKQTAIDEGYGNYIPFKYPHNSSRTGVTIRDHGYNNALDGLTDRYDCAVTLNNCTVSDINHGLEFTTANFLRTVSAMNPVHCWRFDAKDDTVPSEVTIDIYDINMFPVGFSYEWAKYIGLGFGVGFNVIALYGRENAESDYVLIGSYEYDRDRAKVDTCGPVFGWTRNDVFSERTSRYKDLRMKLSFEKTEIYVGCAYVCALSLYGLYDDQHMAFTQSSGDTMYGDLAFSAHDKGIILKSPNGTPYRLTVDDTGTLTASVVTT